MQRLPVSLNDVMVAIVNEAADPLWLAAWRNPATDKEWRALERRAVQLEIAGALLAIPGTGPNDDTWVGNPAWRRWSVALREAGARAAAAAEARDLQDVAASGDEIVEVCEGCHGTFKPDLPTGGKYGELSPTSIDFEDDEE